MSQQVPPMTEAPRPAVPGPRSQDRSSPADSETFSFVDVEHGVLEEAELEAAAAAWDGFLESRRMRLSVKLADEAHRERDAPDRPARSQARHAPRRAAGSELAA